MTELYVWDDIEENLIPFEQRFPGGAKHVPYIESVASKLGSVVSDEVKMLADRGAFDIEICLGDPSTPFPEILFFRYLGGWGAGWSVGLKRSHSAVCQSYLDDGRIGSPKRAYDLFVEMWRSRVEHDQALLMRFERKSE